MTKVIHIKDSPKDWKNNPDYVYIGRSGKGLNGFYGNPFRLYNETERIECLERFTKWFIMRLDDDKEYKQKILELKGKTLICFCKPALCHGDVIADYVNGAK